MTDNRNSMAKVRTLWMDRYTIVIDEDFRERWAIFLLLYIAFSLPILLANRPYIDDIGRSVEGYFGWSLVGRPLASIIMKSISFNNRVMINISPLPQLISIVILSFGSAWATIRFNIPKDVRILSFGLIVCNPFFLENLSYQYDSLPMSIAVILAMFPTLLKEGISTAARSLITIISIICSLSLYQPAANVYVILSLFCVLCGIHTERPAHLTVLTLRCLVYYIISTISYKLLLKLIPLDNYARFHSQTIHLGNIDLVLRNIQTGYLYIWSNLQGPSASLFGIAIAGAAIFTILSSLLIRSKNRLTACSGGVITLVIVVVMIAAIIGPLLLLTNPVWLPRVFLGFGAISACLMSLVVIRTRHAKYRYVTKAIIAIVVFSELPVSYAYGNAFRYQSESDQALAGRIVEDLYTVSKSDSTFLLINGRGPISPMAAEQISEYPIIQSLVYPLMNNSGYWGGVLLRANGLPKSVIVANDIHGDNRTHRVLVACKTIAVISRRYYNIYRNGNDIVIDFSRGCG